MYQSGQGFRGGWLEFLFVIDFVSKTGSIDAKLNSTKVPRYRGSTLFSPALQGREGRTTLDVVVDEYRKDERAKRDAREQP
jgi:hypothetical protein